MNTTKNALVAFLFALAFAFVGSNQALASVTVTAASGGGSLSADRAANASSPAWTALGPITLAEGANGDFGVGTDVTLVLKLPAGFELDPTVTPSLGFTADRGISSASVALTDSSTLTVTLTVTNNTSLDTLILGGTTGLQVRPTAGTPLATGKHIYRPTTGGGTATVTGITTSTDGSTGSNFGNLTEVAGAASAIRVETLATGAGTVVAAQNVTAGATVTGYAIARDTFGNFVINVAADSWSLVNKTGGVADGDLVPAVNLKSAVFAGNLVGTANIQVTSGALTSTDSGTLTVVAGAASKLVFLTAPQSLTAGVISSPLTVQLQDAKGNPVNAASAQTVSLAKTSAGGLFRNTGDTATITSVSLAIGTSTVSFLYQDTRAGTSTLTASRSGWTSATQIEAVSAAAAALVRVETLASGAGTVVAAQNVTAGSSVTGYAIARDAFTNFVANVAADSWSLVNQTAGVVGGDLVPAGDSQSALFTGHVTGTAVIAVTSGALTPVASGTLTVVAGSATRMFVTLPGETFTAGVGNSGTADAQTAGTAFVISKLTATDSYNNIATTFTGTKAITYSGPGGTPAYTTSVSFTSGQSTTALTTTLRKAETTALTATSGTAIGVASSSLTVNPGAFTKLQLLVPGESAVAGTTTGKSGSVTAQAAGAAWTVTVNAVDANWNVITTVGDTVGITSSDANATLPADAALISGSQTFSVTLNTAGSRTVTATDLTDGSKTANTSPAITVSVGSFVKLQLLVPGETAAPGTPSGKTGTPTDRAAGTAFTVTVNAVDDNWNVVASAPADYIALSLSDPNAAAPSASKLSSGTRTFSVTLKTAGSGTITASDSTNPSKTPNTSPDLTVTTGAFAKLQVLVPGETAVPGSATGKSGTVNTQAAGTAFTVTVNAVDANWNLVNTNDTVHLTSTDTSAVLPADTALAAGTQVLSVTLSDAGSQTVTVSDVTQAGITANTSAAIPVTAASFSRLQILMPGETAAPGTPTGKSGTPTARTAGTAFNVTVNAVDVNWNLISTNDTVAITSSDASATLPADAALVAGTKTFSITLKTSGSQTVTASDATQGSITPDTGSASPVNPAAANKLVLVTEPSATAQAGVAFAQQPVVQIQDIYGNVRSNDTLTVTAARLAGAGVLQGTTSLAAVGGVAAYTDLAHWYATNITLRFTSGSLVAATSSEVAVSAGPFSRLLVMLPGESSAPGTATGRSGTPTAMAGSSTAVRVQATDDYFNPVAAVTDTVGITSSDAIADLPADAALVDGTNTFNLTFKTGGSQTVTAMDITDGTKTPNTDTVTVSAGAFAKVQLLLPGETAAPGTATGKTGTPNAQTAGTAFTVTVNGVDDNWNKVSVGGASYTMRLTSTDANSTMPSDANLAAGTVSMSVTLKTAGSATLTASDLDDGTKTPSTSPAITVNLGAFTKLQVLVPGEVAAPGSATGKIGTPLTNAVGAPFFVTVNAVDANWNVIDTNDTVQITSSDTAAKLPDDAALVNGTQTFSLTLQTPGSRTVTASDVTNGGITAGTSAAITVKAANFTKLQVLMPGETAAANTPTGKTGTPTVRTAGTAFTITVNAVDANWNVVSTNDTVAITSSDANATLPANAALVAGTKTFNVTLKTAGSQTVTASDATDGSITPDTGTAATVNAAVAAKLAMGTEPSATALAGEVFAQQPVVQIQDTYGNVRTNDTLTVTAARLAGAGTLQGATTLAAVGGVATYTNLAHLWATNITLRFTCGSLIAATSGVVNVSAGSFSGLLVMLPGESSAPGTATGRSGTPSATVGLETPVRIHATDVYFNPVAGVSDTVGITCSDANAVLPADAALVDGTNTVNLTFKTLGANTVTATDLTDGSKTANTDPVTVGVGAFVKLQLLLPGETAAPGTASGKSGTPTAQTAGTAFTVTVNGVDANWYVVPTASGGNYTIHLASSDLNAIIPANANLLTGTQTFSVTLKTAGSWTVTATDVDDGTKTPSTSPETTVAVGAFAKLQLLMPGETPAPGTATGKTGTPVAQSAGNPLAVTVNAVDANWNLVNTVSDTVAITSSDLNAPPTPDLALSGGTQTFAFVFFTAGSRTVTATDITDGTKTPNTGTATTVTAGSLTKLRLLMPGETAAPGTATGKTGTPSARLAGTAFTVTVNAVDAMWNIVSTSHTVRITSSDTNAVLPANAALSSGVRTFSVTLKTAGNQTVTASDFTDGNVTPDTGTATAVNAAAFAKLQLLVPGETAAPGTASGKTGAPMEQNSNIVFTVTVNGVDANWNLVNTNDTIHITSSDTNAVVPADAALSGGTQSFSVALMTPGTATLTAANVTHTGIAANTSPAITVVNKLAQTITFEPLADKNYGDADFDLSATASSGLPVAFSIVSGPATIAGATLTITGAGTVTVRASQAGNETYRIAPAVDQPFTVNAAALTVTAENKSRTYGAADPAFTASYSGFVNGDTASVLSGSPNLTTAATVTDPVGAYTITAAVGTLSAANYTFSFVDGQLSVIPATLTVTAQDTWRSYGEANPAFTASLAGFINGDNASVVSGSPELTTTAETNSPLGTYPITAALGTLSAVNYSFGFVDGTLTVTPAGTLFYDDFARTADPGSLAPWIVHSDIWTINSGILEGSNTTAETYEDIYITNQWANYSVEAKVRFPVGGFGGGLGGRLDALTGAHYGAWIYPEDSTGGSSVIKLVKFQNWTTFGYTNTAAIPMAQASLPGVGTNWHTLKLDFQDNLITVSYDGTQMMSVTDLEAVPYSAGAVCLNMWNGSTNDLMQVDQVLVTGTAKTHQTITFNPLADQTYGDAAFALSATASSGLPVSFNIVSGPASLAGDTLTITGAGLVTVRAAQAGNTSYNPAPDVDQSFTVTPAPITVTADAKTKVYGDTDPELTWQITSGALVSGDSITGSLSRVAGETVGSYAIEQDTLTAGTNYDLTYVGADLAVTPADSATALVASENPSAQGSSVTFTATVTPVAPASTTPTGTVQFYTNGVAAGSPVALSVGGVANLALADLPAGTNTVAATYLGDANFNNSSNSLAQVVTIVVQTPSTFGIQNNGDGTVTATFAGTPGAEYVVQACSDLGAPSWANVSTNTAAADGKWTFTDSTTGQPVRFYRSAKP